MTIDPKIGSVFAPSGKLRAAINLGNPLLARVDMPPASNPRGVAIDIAAAFAKRLQVDVEYLLFHTAGEAVKAVENGTADIGFFALEPLRGGEVAFSPAYLLLEGSYLVREGSPIHRNEEVDRRGNTVVVGQRSAYDLYLTRELKYASIVRAPTSSAVVDVFIEQHADVAAGVRQQLEGDAKRVPGLRLLDGRFMLIRQAIGISKARGAEAAAILGQFVEELKATGFVAEALARHRIEGATVAPPET